MQFKDNNSVVSQLNFWKAKLIIINILCINNYTLWQLDLRPGAMVAKYIFN